MVEDGPRVTIAVRDRRLEGRVRAAMRSHWTVRTRDPDRPPRTGANSVWATDSPELQEALTRGVFRGALGVILLLDDEISVWTPGGRHRTRDRTSRAMRVVRAEVVRCWLRVVEHALLLSLGEASDHIPRSVVAYVR